MPQTTQRLQRMFANGLQLNDASGTFSERVYHSFGNFDVIQVYGKLTHLLNSVKYY